MIQIPTITARMRAAFKEFWDGYFDQFTEPMKVKYPKPFTFWRPDNNEGMKLDTKPRGYWYAHVVGWFWLLVIIAACVIVGMVVFGYWDVDL